MSSKVDDVSLIGLPRELRDQILDFVVMVEPHRAPLRNLTSEMRLVDEERHEVNDIPYKSKNRGAGVFYTNDLGRFRLFPTLLVSHQLHAKTLAAIDRLPTKHSYRLDIAVVNGDQLWPTWLSIPALTTQIDHVYATIRTCELINHLRDADDFFVGGFLSGYERPKAAWAFYDLLEQFLTVGPSTQEPDLWSSRAWGETRRTSIKTLDLDAITIDVSKLRDFPTNGDFHLPSY
jgi:hypothetical protein